MFYQAAEITVKTDDHTKICKFIDVLHSIIKQKSVICAIDIYTHMSKEYYLYWVNPRTVCALTH